MLRWTLGWVRRWEIRARPVWPVPPRMAYRCSGVLVSWAILLWVLMRSKKLSEHGQRTIVMRFGESSSMTLVCMQAVKLRNHLMPVPQSGIGTGP